MEIDGAHHLRAAPRYKLFQPTEICVKSSIRRVHLLNLSVGGALVYANDPPTIGTPIVVACGSRSVPARVAWNDDRRFGAAFMAPLSDSDVKEVIAAHDALARGNVTSATIGSSR